MTSYFYLDSQNRNQGPVPLDRLAEHGVTRNTMIWCDGMANWQRADSVPEVREWFDAHTADTTTAAGNATAQSADFSNPYAQNNGAPAYTTPQNQGYMPCPNDYLVWSVLATICCCLPFGIVAIVKSCNVGKFYRRGMYDAALLASEDAKKWCLISLVVGLILQVVGGCLQFCGGLLSAL